MSYTLFTEKEVFEDPSINIACNMIYEILLEKYNLGEINANFFVTGSVSRILQDEPNEPVKCISFGTINDDMHELLSVRVNEVLGGLGSVMLSDVIQFTFNENVYFEFWKMASVGGTISVEGIICQGLEHIPIYIL